MNRKEKIEILRNDIAKSKDFTYITETKDNIVWCCYTGWDSIIKTLKKKNIEYKYLGEIKYRFFDLDFGNSTIDEYKYKSKKIDGYIYIYEWAHGVVDTVDYVSYFSLKRLTSEEIHKILRLHDIIMMDNLRGKKREE